MKKRVLRLATVMLVGGMIFPAISRASDDEIQKKIDKLTQEVEELKNSVKKGDNKSIGKWLTIGGDYRFRYDYLKGETKPFVEGDEIRCKFNKQDSKNSSKTFVKTAGC